LKTVFSKYDLGREFFIDNSLTAIEFEITCHTTARWKASDCENVYNLVKFDMNALIKLSNVKSFKSAFEAPRRNARGGR
jgi:hypothetical protein